MKVTTTYIGGPLDGLKFSADVSEQKFASPFLRFEYIRAGDRARAVGRYRFERAGEDVVLVHVPSELDAPFPKRKRRKKS